MRPVTSASNLFRRFLCPGSARLEAGLPEEDSEQSREGVVLHDYAAHPEYDPLFLSDEQRRLLDLSHTLVKQVIDLVESKYNLKLGSIEFIEHPLLADLGQVDLVGTPDIVRLYVKDKSVLVIDRKFGYKIVERAELNLQLRAYAVMANYSWAEGDLFANSIVATVQPRLAYDERITVAGYSPEEIRQSSTQLVRILERTLDKNAPLHASEEACRYCKAKLICPEFKRFMEQPLVPFQTDGQWTVAKRAEYIEHRLSQCSDTALANILDALTLAGMVEGPAKDEARKRIRDGRLTTHTLGKESEVPAIVNAKRAMAILSLSRIMTTEQVMELMDLKLKPIRDAYRALSGCTWKEARDKIDKVLESVIQIENRKPRVIKKGRR